MLNTVVLILSPLVLLASCTNSSGVAGVKGAAGETPVRYVLCAAGEQNCFVSARFKDFAACESHKAWAEMLCDSMSNPGAMVCKKDTRPQLAFAYCTN